MRVLVVGLVSLWAAAALAQGGTFIAINQHKHTVDFVDPATGALIAETSVGINGHEAAVSPDGKLVYVPIYSSVGVGKVGTNGQTIAVLDVKTHQVVDTIDFGHPVRPHYAEFGPDGMLYVSAELDKAIAVVDPATKKVIAEIPTGAEESHVFKISLDGKQIFTANVDSRSVSVMDVKTRSLVKVIPIDGRMQRMAFSKDGHWAFSSDWEKPRLAVIDTKTDELKQWVDVAGIPYATVATPDGKMQLIAEHEGATGGQVQVLDLASMKIVKTIHVESFPGEFLVHDGVAYMTCMGSGRVEKLDLKTWELMKPIVLEPGVDGMAWAR